MTDASFGNLTDCGDGLYVHVPFCATRCAYCAFYGEQPRRQDIDAYLRCLELEWRMRGMGGSFETIFFGGGTPGALSCADFEKISKFLPIDDVALREWTVELSPATVTAEKLRLFNDLAVTRLSIGVQSFNDGTLAAMGRRQLAKKSLDAYALCREFDFSINLDLIFNVPGQTMQSWEKDLELAIAIGPDHLSTYCLTVEAEALLWKNEKPQMNSDDLEFYELTWNILAANGYEHYEVSNFCRPGRRCLHNCNGWAMGEWLGLGPSAASQFRRRRFRNVANLNLWMDGICRNSPVEEDAVPLSRHLLAEDSIMFAMRTCDGISVAALAAAQEFASADLASLFEDFRDYGLVVFANGRAKPTDRGLLLADAMALEILKCFK
ncbi:MAG: radical SAM family heme chaperone HemW [Puniceicoccales bacterium]|nr:radical SAM family heme chaperone HemW [Puniceicoccales bacterium]